MKLNKIGEESLEKFVKVLCKLLITDKRKFDLITSAGDSGQIMIFITKKVYELLDVPIPPSIIFPIYRYKDYPKKILFDNSSVLNDYSNKNIPSNIKNILYVDDEIDQGNSAWATINLIRTLKRIDNFTYTIIAEDGKFNKRNFDNQNFNIEYISPKKRAYGVYNAISYTIPKEFEDPIQKALTKEKIIWKDKQIMCILLNLPIKELNNGKPEFNFRLFEIVKILIPNFNDLQKNYQKYLTDKIYSIIKE